ncbi:MAG TPA: hypothetical protein VMF06_08900 [Candidatus Limnocylindria bacterium]|nr:hypothetical protein [Candidatus Limnocylindria bacterium]
MLRIHFASKRRTRNGQNITIPSKFKIHLNSLFIEIEPEEIATSTLKKLNELRHLFQKDGQIETVYRPCPKFRRFDYKLGSTTLESTTHVGENRSHIFQFFIIFPALQGLARISRTSSKSKQPFPWLSLAY